MKERATQEKIRIGNNGKKNRHKNNHELYLGKTTNLEWLYPKNDWGKTKQEGNLMELGI